MPYKLSDNFVSEVVKLTSGFLEPAELDRFFDSVEAELQKHHSTFSTENNLIRILQAFFDRTFLIRDASKYKHYVEILSAAAANSNYICDILVHDPEFFYWISNPSNLSAKPTVSDLKDYALDLAGRYASFPAKVNALRSFKRKEILRTGIQDLLGIINLEETAARLSSIASAILGSLFTACYDEVKKKTGTELTGSYCIISLGKLGGNELNYSSDTDLMIFYDKDKKAGPRNYSEYLTEAVKLFIESSSRLTGDGYLYRIDFRLRPDGKNSPLCRSLTGYLNYYETRGESWERQMLIKSSYLSGSRSLYSKFISYLTPFIYPSALTASPAEQVRKLKTVIEKNLRDELNIKLTKGGIRDIEFSVQVLQLLNGGKIPDLREPNTLNAVRKLNSYKLISDEEKEILVSSYIFYRRVEHYLQLMNDRQVHTIPEAGEIVDKMSRYLGFADRNEFLTELNKKRKEVRSFYNSVTGSSETEPSATIFLNKDQAKKDLEFLREGKGLTGRKLFDKQTQNAFQDIEPGLIKILKEQVNPDIVLSRMVYILKSTGLPSVWYHQFSDPVFLQDFIKICMNSAKAVNLLGSDEALHDFVLSRKIFSEFQDDEINRLQISNILLYLAARLALNKIEPVRFSSILSLYIKKRIAEIFSASEISGGYAAAAMGSLGSHEMTFASDLDLIFIVKKSSPAKEKLFREILGTINKELAPFKADCRLRPEGAGSQLVWELDSYKKYISSRARIWELQSLSKISFITGDSRIIDSLLESAYERIKAEDCGVIKKNVLEMRNKITDSPLTAYSKNFHIKKSPGGLTDIEFIIQYLILCTPELFRKCAGRSISENIDILIRASEKNKSLEVLKKNSSFLFKLKMIIQSAFDTDKGIVPSEEEKKKIIASNLEAAPGLIDDRIKNIIKENKSVFESIFK